MRVIGSSISVTLLPEKKTLIKDSDYVIMRVILVYNNICIYIEFIDSTGLNYIMFTLNSVALRN